MVRVSRNHLGSCPHCTYLAELKTVIYHNFEWSHHDFTNQLRFDHGFLQDKRHQCTQMAEHQVRLVVSCRCESRHAQPTVVRVEVLKHGREHGEKVVLQDSIKFVTAVSESVS